MLFDGKAFAQKIEEKVRSKVAKLTIRPKIVSVLVGSDPASELYTRLKSEAAKRVGIEFEVERFEAGVRKEELERRVVEVGSREEVTGVMVQLPIPNLTRAETEQVLRAIPLSKDVDGLRGEESGIMPAVVRAILVILDELGRSSIKDQVSSIWEKRLVVVGGTGTVGKSLVTWLKKQYGVVAGVVSSQTENWTDELRQAEVIISCVGKEGLITAEMISEQSIVVDVGAPRGDMTKEVYAKAKIAVPVPNGVGPVTIACLLENTEEIYVCTRG